MLFALLSLRWELVLIPAEWQQNPGESHLPLQQERVTSLGWAQLHGTETGGGQSSSGSSLSCSREYGAVERPSLSGHGNLACLCPGQGSHWEPLH